MNTPAFPTQFAYQLIVGDEFWLAGRLYQVAHTYNNEYGVWSIVFFDPQSSPAANLLLRVPVNTPFEIHQKK